MENNENIERNIISSSLIIIGILFLLFTFVKLVLNMSQSGFSLIIGLILIIVGVLIHSKNTI